MNPRLVASPSGGVPVPLKPCESILITKGTVLEITISWVILSSVHVNVETSGAMLVNAVARVETSGAMLYAPLATTTLTVFEPSKPMASKTTSSFHDMVKALLVPYSRRS